MHKLVNGKKIPLTEEEIKTFNEREAKHELKLISYGYRLAQVHKARSAEYRKIGDQLDALLKQHNYDRMNGKNLVSELDEIIGEHLAIKKKYPKPGVRK
jgi:hypothetical protein